jgi:hypothetical protein
MFLKSMNADSPSHPCYQYWTITLSIYLSLIDVNKPSYATLYGGYLDLLIVIYDRKQNSRSVLNADF